jgi:hypothetical protein
MSRGPSTFPATDEASTPMRHQPSTAAIAAAVRRSDRPAAPQVEACPDCDGIDLHPVLLCEEIRSGEVLVLADVPGVTCPSCGAASLHPDVEAELDDALAVEAAFTEIVSRLSAEPLPPERHLRV